MMRFLKKFLLLALLFCGYSASAADSDIYKVTGVAASASGNSPAAAKNFAHSSALREAFTTLLSRLEMKSEIADSVSEEEIVDMVRSEQIENEKIVGNSYSATLNIEFSKDFVEHILANKKKVSSQVKVTSQRYVLIPVISKKYEPAVWNEGNQWKKSVGKNIERKSVNKFLIPDGDIADIAALGGVDLTKIDYAQIQPVLAKYKANAAYSLVFSYDEIESRALVEVVRIDQSQSKRVKLSFADANKVNLSYLVDRVAEKTIDYLMNSVGAFDQNSDPSLIKLRVEIGSLLDWMMLKTKLENSGLINQINLDLISRDNVLLSVNYIGNGNFVDAFAQKGIALSPQPDNYFKINAK